MDEQDSAPVDMSDDEPLDQNQAFGLVKPQKHKSAPSKTQARAVSPKGRKSKNSSSVKSELMIPPEPSLQNKASDYGVSEVNEQDIEERVSSLLGKRQRRSVSKME